MARHRGMAPIIQAVKHYVHRPAINVTGGTVRNVNVAVAEIAPATTLAEDVQEGSIIKAIYAELCVLSQGASATIAVVTSAFEKRPSDAPAMTFAQSVNLGAYPNKKNIMFAGQGNFGPIVGGTFPFNLYKGWIKIPKGKQRMGVGDRLVFNVSATTEDLSLCGLFTYKEYK